MQRERDRRAIMPISRFLNGQHLDPETRRLMGVAFEMARDPPPLKWSDLRYVFDIKEDCNGKEAIQA